VSEKKKVNVYTAEFRESAVKLAVESDQPITQTARELGINCNTLHTWISKYHRSEQVVQKVSDEHLYDELKRLKKENARLKEERDILILLCHISGCFMPMLIVSLSYCFIRSIYDVLVKFLPPALQRPLKASQIASPATYSNFHLFSLPAPEVWWRRSVAMSMDCSNPAGAPCCV